MHGGQHHVRQDKDYVSVIQQADVDAFLSAHGKPPTPSQAAYQAVIAHRTSTTESGGKRTTIGQDMPLAPTRYGFADRQAVDAWLELALDSPKT